MQNPAGLPPPAGEGGWRSTAQALGISAVSGTSPWSRALRTSLPVTASGTQHLWSHPEGSEVALHSRCVSQLDPTRFPWVWARSAHGAGCRWSLRATRLQPVGLGLHVATSG